MLIFCPSISNVLVSRFLLDLRGIYYNHNDASHATSTANFVCSVRFASDHIAGNIGAPLDAEKSTWMTGASEGSESTFAIEKVETDDPLAYGLGVDSESGQSSNDTMT